MQGGDVRRMVAVDNRAKQRPTVAQPLTSVRIVARSGANYTATIGWLLRRSVEGRKLKFAVVFGLGQLYLAGQAAAIFTLYWYAEQAQSDALVSLRALGIELRAREDPMLLLIVVAVSVVCFLASNGVLYLSRSMVIGVGEEDVALGLTQLIGIARRLPDPRAPVASQLLIRDGLKKVNAGCRMGGIATVLLLNAVTPVVGGVVAVGALLWIDAVLTTMIVIGAALWSTLLYPLTQRQLRFALSRGREGAAFKEEARALLQSPSTAIPEKLDSAVRIAEVYLGRRRVMNEMRLVLQIGATLIGALAAFYLATGIMGGGGDWPIFIVYLGGLRIALSGCFAAPRTLGAVSRFYPQLASFVRFLQSAAQIDREELGHVRNGDAVMLGSLPDATEVSARSGDLLALATLDTRQTLESVFLQARAAGTGQPLARTWVETAALSARACDDNPIAVVDVGTLAQMEKPAALSFLQGLQDSVSVILHRDEAQVGAFGERHLIVVVEGAITASVPLGTAESRAALESFAELRRSKSNAKPDDAHEAEAGADDDRDEDEEA